MTREEEIKFRDECAKIAFQAQPPLAAKAAMLATPDQLGELIQAIAESSYDYANAMLEEKKKRDKQEDKLVDADDVAGAVRWVTK